MRANARRTAWLTGALRDQLERVRQKLASGQRELEGARNAMVLAISMARAAGAPVEDLEVFNATRDAIGESPAGEQLRELEARVELLCQRANGG